MNCNRCGQPLKEIRVKVPVYLEHYSLTDLPEKGIETQKVLARYEEKTEYADCPRCTGAY